MITLLPGFSGCSIKVEPVGSAYHLIKGTPNSEYIPRLLEQASKQIRYAQLDLPESFYVPRVFDVHKDAESASISMEYIRAFDVVTFLSFAGHEHIEWFQQRLLELVQFFHRHSLISDVPKATLIDKLNVTVEKILASGRQDSTAIEPLLEKTRRYFDDMPSTLRLPTGECHGDLTLSNVLIDPAGPRIVLIDFLDSFVETPLADMVKLRQDTRHAWSCTIFTGQFPKVRLQTIMQYMDGFLDAQFRQYSYYVESYKYFQLLNLLRILPYITNSRFQYLLYDALRTELT